MLEDDDKVAGAAAMSDGAIGVDDGDAPETRFMVCLADQNGIHPKTPFDDQELAIAAATVLSTQGPTACVVLESKLATADKGDGIVVAFRQGKVFPLRDNLVRAQQDLEEMMERRRRQAEKRREAEAKKRRADQILYGTVAGFCGIVVTLVIIQAFL